MTKVTIDIDTDTLKRLICNEINRTLGDEVDLEDVTIEVKASMNYKSEWEKGEFRAKISKFI